jgi:hypothetical protein
MNQNGCARINQNGCASCARLRRQLRPAARLPEHVYRLRGSFRVARTLHPKP